MPKTAALDTRNDKGNERFQDDASMFRDNLREKALKAYKRELSCPANLDLGLHGVTRANLRVLCRTAVLESSTQMRKRYSHSNMSSSMGSTQDESDKVSALRSLQKERLVVSRLGFVDRAMELDQEIEMMRQKVKVAREQEETVMLDQRLKLLSVSHMRKQAKLEYILNEEMKQTMGKIASEEAKMARRHEIEFMRVLEGATRRAVGRVKKCNCHEPYLCRHNKTASYNTRRPSKTVVTYRRNARRLKQAGRPEEAIIWEEKAKELDEEEQENWRNRIADGIIASPWGANEALVDQITEDHKKELHVLNKTHEFKLETIRKQHETRRKNFRNALIGEERKMRIQVHKQCLLRTSVNVEEEYLEKKKEKQLSYKSDGLKNISKNLLGLEFDDEERAAVDWVPPTAFGLDNSVRLYDALQEAEREGGGNQSNADDPSKLRILTKFGDIKNKTTKEIQDKIQRDLTGPETSDDDEDDEDEEDRADDDSSSASSAGGSYSFGSTSGSKLVDKLRVKAHKAKVLAGNASNTPSGSVTGGASSFSSPAGTFTAGASSSFGSFPSQNSSFGGGFPIASNPFGSSISSFGSSSVASNDSGGLSNGSNAFGTVATLSASSSGDVNKMAASSLGPSAGSIGAIAGTDGLGGFPAGGMGSSSFGAASFGASSSTFANPFVNSSPPSAFPASSVFDAPSTQSTSPFQSQSQSQSLSNSWSGTQSVGHSQALPPPYPAPSDTSYRAGKNILSTESPSWMSPDTVSFNLKTDSDVKTTGFDNLKSIEKVITHDSSLDAINHKSTTGVALLCATVLKYEDEKRTWIRRSQPLPVDWTLDAEDKKTPTFKPRSTRDKDWTQKDAALGKGVENSYNVPITYESQQAQIQREQFEENSDFNPSHEPPLRGSPHSVPKRSAIKPSNTSSTLTTSNQQSSLMSSNARKTVQFGGVIVKTFVTPVYDYSESNVAPPLPPRPQLTPVSSAFTRDVPASATLLTGNDLMGEGGVTNNHIELHTGFEQLPAPAEEAVNANDDEQEVNQEDEEEGGDYEDDEDSDE